MALTETDEGMLCGETLRALEAGCFRVIQGTGKMYITSWFEQWDGMYLVMLEV